MEADRSFTRDEVNKIVEERLRRQRIKDEALLELKTALFDMKDRGVLDGQSVPELAKCLMDKLSDIKSPLVQEPANEETVQAEVIPEAPMASRDAVLDENELFAAFLEAKEKYEREKRALLSMKHTPVCQSTAGVAETLLTPRQRSIARNGGISYKEYARLLEQIPKRTF